MYVYIYIYMYTYMSMSTYIYIYIHICTCTYTTLGPADAEHEDGPRNSECKMCHLEALTVVYLCVLIVKYTIEVLTIVYYSKILRGVCLILY